MENFNVDKALFTALTTPYEPVSKAETAVILKKTFKDDVEDIQTECLEDIDKSDPNNSIYHIDSDIDESEPESEDFIDKSKQIFSINDKNAFLLKVNFYL